MILLLEFSFCLQKTNQISSNGYIVRNISQKVPHDPQNRNNKVAREVWIEVMFDFMSLSH